MFQLECCHKKLMLTELKEVNQDLMPQINIDLYLPLAGLAGKASVAFIKKHSNIKIASFPAEKSI